MKRGMGVLAAALVTMAMVPTADAAGEFIWSVGGRITSTWRYPSGSIHSGSADIGAASWTQIGASRYGSSYAFWQAGGCGYGVRITHTSGYSTIYCHFVRWPAVGSQSVKTNQLIGYVGSTGNSTGPHLHYGLLRWGTRQIIPGLYFGQYVTRGRAVPGTWSGLSSTTSSTSPSGVLFRAKVTVSALNVRTGPSTGYSIVGTLGYGTIVNVYGTSGSWYKISYGGYYRWIAGWLTARV